MIEEKQTLDEMIADFNEGMKEAKKITFKYDRKKTIFEDNKPFYFFDNFFMTDDTSLKYKRVGDKFYKKRWNEEWVEINKDDLFSGQWFRYLEG